MDWLKKGAQRVASYTGATDAFIGQEVEIATKKVRIRRVVAEGGFGIVYCGKDVATGEEYAVKRLRVSEPDQLAMVEKEISCMTRLRSAPHKHIIGLYGVLQVEASRGIPADIQILMEFCSAGTLADLVAARAVSSAEVVVLQTQCCDAVAHLHSLQPSIIHRDIKLENFLLSASGGVKLCDFGSVTSKSVVPLELTFSQISAAEEDMNLNTTPQNRSPEMLDMHSGKVVGKAGDVWALGCGMFFLCFRTHPFEDAAKLAIINAKYRLPPAETSKHASLHHIITSLLNTNPDDRPSARGAVEMLQSAGIPGVNLVNPQAFVSHVSAAASAPTSPNPRTTAMSPDTTNEAGPTASESGGASTRARGLFGSLGSGAASMVSKARDRAGVAVRSAVSKVTRGLDETNKHGGTAGDLDLTYICPRVLVMATPADPADLAAYLQAEHPQQCLVFDLSDPKRQLDSARFPSIPIEHVKWQAGQSCSLKRLFMLCSAIHGWLLKSTTNVVAVHCPTGREDAGTVAAAYLAFSRLCSAQDAMRLFHMKRMAEGKRAITMSQQPYIGYIHKIVSGKPPHVRAIHIGSVVLETIPLFNTRGTGCKPYLEVYQSGKLVKRAPDPAASTLYTNESGVSATIDVGVDVVGDVLIIAFHEYTMLGHSTSTEMFSIQFHTGFVDDKGYLRPGFEIEAPRKKPAKFDRAFGVRVDCKIVNKQLKKEMPWQAAGCIPALHTGQATCFFQQTEAVQVLQDLENSKRSFTDSNRSTHADGGESARALSDDEDEMSDANPVSLLDFGEATPAPASSSTAGVLDPVRSKSGTSNMSADLFDFGMPATAPPIETNGNAKASTPPHFVGTPPATADNGLSDLFGGPAGGQSVGMSESVGSNMGDLWGATDPPASGNGVDLSDLFSGASAVPPVAPQSSGQTDMFGGLTFGGRSTSSSDGPPTPGASANGGADLFGSFGGGSGSGTASASGGSSMFGGLGGRGSAPASNRPKTPPKQQLFGGLGSLRFGANANTAAAPPAAASSGAAGAATASSAAPPFSSFEVGRMGTNGATQGGAQGTPQRVPPTQPTPASAASRPGLTRTHSMPNQSSFGPQSPNKGGGGLFDFAGAGMPSKDRPLDRKTIGQLKVTERLLTEDPDKIKVELWADSKKENVRALLSTLQDILWEGRDGVQKWTIVGLGQLIDANDVDKAYKKSCRILHPDKIKEDHPHHNLAHHIFIAVTKANQKWKDEGGKSM